ncbi:uncharacterized protein LOC106153973 [Lingula anatina]|uniref:Uncharacterized protein LOC106153973 n=1 Tax=Lingula anatina TaxID=7574 RepID=A0A1S3HC66_LINAN|nr:uncharacterized protein LOC106153973 [Lingula anatina]|eukprot:XP_013383590.1 uncharacterized protein LOC106153973 [Lingula anatina]
METEDYVCTGSFIFTFFVAIVSGRRAWMLIDMISTIVFGVWFFFPKSILPLQADLVIDSGHVLLCHMVAATLLGSAVVWALSRNSSDETVQVTMLITRVLSASLILIYMIYAQYANAQAKHGRFTQQNYWFGILGTTLWDLGNIIQLLRTVEWGGGAENTSSGLDHSLRRDFFVIFIGGVVMATFAGSTVQCLFPHLILDGIHSHMDRTVGALNIGMAFLSFIAPGFHSDEDKRAVLLGRIVQCIMLLASVAWQHFYIISMTTTQTLTVGAPLALLPASNYWFGILGTTLWDLGNIIQLLRTVEWGGGAENTSSGLDHSLRRDFFVIFIGGVVMATFAGSTVQCLFPHLILDGIHSHMDRTVGALNIGMAFLSFIAPGFHSDEDKRAVLLGRIVQCIMLLASVAWQHFYIISMTTTQTLTVGAPLALLLLSGYLSSGERKKED